MFFFFQTIVLVAVLFHPALAKLPPSSSPTTGFNFKNAFSASSSSDSSHDVKPNHSSSNDDDKIPINTSYPFDKSKQTSDERIARDQLFTSIFGFAKGLLSLFVCAKVLEMVSVFAETLLTGLKEMTVVPHWNASLSPNITKFISPNVTLSSHEIEILQHVVDPTSPELQHFKALGGLTHVKEALVNCVADLIDDDDDDDTEKEGGGRGGMYGGPDTTVHGLLLFGPPGCGKTALVNALCKKTKLPMIRVVPSLLLRKYVGETSLMTRAIFSAAKKLQPCILFVDEMDALFRERHDGDHHVERSLVTEFMQLWDSLQSKSVTSSSDASNIGKIHGGGGGGSGCKVLVIGATNRPQDLDPAIQRRFERSFLVGPPDEATRELVFKAILREVNKDKAFDFTACARMTDGYSPSDITSLCKAAVSLPINERRRAMKSGTGAALRHRKDSSMKGGKNGNGKRGDGKNGDGKSGDEDDGGSGMGQPSDRSSSLVPLRPLSLMDIEQAMQSVFPTQWAARSYGSLQRQQQQQQQQTHQYYNQPLNPPFHPPSGGQGQGQGPYGQHPHPQNEPPNSGSMPNNNNNNNLHNGENWENYPLVDEPDDDEDD